MGDAGGAGRPRRHAHRGGGPRPGGVRQPDREADGRTRRTATRRSTACGARSTRPRSAASRRRCRSTGSSRAATRSAPPSCRRAGSRRTGTARPRGPRRVRRALLAVGLAALDGDGPAAARRAPTPAGVDAGVERPLPPTRRMARVGARAGDRPLADLTAARRAAESTDRQRRRRPRGRVEPEPRRRRHPSTRAPSASAWPRRRGSATSRRWSSPGRPAGRDCPCAKTRTRRRGRDAGPASCRSTPPATGSPRMGRRRRSSSSPSRPGRAGSASGRSSSTASASRSRSEPERLAALRERATRGGATAGHAGPLEVRAVIPGRVLAVAVAAGDEVDGRDQRCSWSRR